MILNLKCEYISIVITITVLSVSVTLTYLLTYLLTYCLTETREVLNLLVAYILMEYCRYTLVGGNCTEMS